MRNFLSRAFGAPRRESFDAVISRINTDSSKWDFCAEHLNFFEDAKSAAHKKALLPMWIADMDFLCAPPIREAVRRVAQRGIYGYSEPAANFKATLSTWFLEQHSWDVPEASIMYAGAAMTSLYLILHAFTKEGDGVLTHQPAYPPIASIIKNTKRTLMAHELVRNGAHFETDFDALERDLPRAAALVLCNPHNPTGMVYREDELLRIARLCEQHNVLIISDDVHCDIVYAPRAYAPMHRVLAAQAPEILQRLITIVSPGKLFNTAGLKCALMIISDEARRRTLQLAQQTCLGSLIFSPFAVAVLEAAYGSCAAWKQDAVSYLRDNRDFFRAYVQDNLPGVKLAQNEATFLAWMDFGGYLKDRGMSYADLQKTLLSKARVGLSSGEAFGLGGQNHMRLNFGCPRSVLKEGLERIRRALF